VEVLTTDAGAPSRSWLHHHLDCMRTARAREKISDWFHDRPDEENREEGRALLERTFARLALPAPAGSTVAAAGSRLGYPGEEACLVALGCGDCQVLDLLTELLPEKARQSSDATQTSAEAQMMPIMQMSLIDDAADPVEMSKASYNIEMLADDRSGLLMDITTFLGSAGIMLLSNSGRVIPSTGDALITIEVQMDSLIELNKLLDALEMIPAVRAAKLIDSPL
jgi:(p)ppGpp synthase/HD superfamily hydrolase